MATEAHPSLMVWAVLPPVLLERTNEAALEKVGRQLLASKGFASAVLKKVDELEDTVFNSETPSWGIWPLWLDSAGLEFCCAIGLMLGYRVKAYLSDQGVDTKFAKTIIESLIEEKGNARSH